MEGGVGCEARMWSQACTTCTMHLAHTQKTRIASRDIPHRHGAHTHTRTSSWYVQKKMLPVMACSSGKSRSSSLTPMLPSNTCKAHARTHTVKGWRPGIRGSTCRKGRRNIQHKSTHKHTCVRVHTQTDTDTHITSVGRRDKSAGSKLGTAQLHYHSTASEFCLAAWCHQSEATNP